MNGEGEAVNDSPSKEEPISKNNNSEGVDMEGGDE